MSQNTNTAALSRSEAEARLVRLIDGMAPDDQAAMWLLLEVMSALGSEEIEHVDSAWLSIAASEAPHLLPIVKASVPVRRRAA